LRGDVELADDAEADVEDLLLGLVGEAERG